MEGEPAIEKNLYLSLCSSVDSEGHVLLQVRTRILLPFVCLLLCSGVG
jgi:hypothetical protein